MVKLFAISLIRYNIIISNIKFALCLGLKVKKANNNGNTPLHRAVTFERNYVVRYLVDQGADIDKTNNTYWNNRKIHSLERTHYEKQF